MGCAPSEEGCGVGGNEAPYASWICCADIFGHSCGGREGAPYAFSIALESMMGRSSSDVPVSLESEESHLDLGSGTVYKCGGWKKGGGVEVERGYSSNEIVYKTETKSWIKKERNLESVASV